MQIAHRMQQIDSSGIRKVFDLAQRMENPVNLSIGQPDFDPPEEVRTRVEAALREGRNRYTVTQGVEELRAEVRHHLATRKGFEPEEVMITSGVAGGIFLAFCALVNAGDEVIIPDPYFVIYRHICTLLGAVPRFLDTYPDFQLTAERLAPMLTDRTRLLVVNNPSNPTGVMLGEKTLNEIAELCAKRGIAILSDEIYDFFAYDEPHYCMGACAPGSLVLGGFSKSFGIPGWRVGYAAGPKELIAEMIKLQQYSFVCAPAPFQYGLVGACSIDMTAILDEYRKKRDLLCEGLKGCYDFEVPGGAFYLFPRSPAGSGTAFAERAVEKNLLLVPGSVFSERDTHFRISYAVSTETLTHAIAILRELAGVV